jgi:DNA-directed RNA polymerase subunit M/transcription elongation factor TFIIS
MEFCDNCNNKMNIKWKFSSNDEDKKKMLVYYCITCGNTKEYDKNTIINTKLFQQNYEIDKSFITFNNELLCEDPTLQKVNNPDIKCPNCTKKPHPDILFYIYDIDNMKYLYICSHCKVSWKTE